jgi:bifunctional non-homologous end joining protein LigD
MFEFCLPTRSTTVPDGPDSQHEIKYDGYRLRLERNGDRVKLITRGGYDWTKRFPWIEEAARKIRQKQFVLDSEADILGVDGISDLDALHSGKQNDEVQFLIFWSRAATICASCRCQCARLILKGCWPGGQKAFSLIHSSVVNRS